MERNIRDMIAHHLLLRDKLMKAATEVNLLIKDAAQKCRLIKDIAKKYGLEYKILERKIDITNSKNQFYFEKSRFEDATRKIIGDYGKLITIKAAAFQYGINVARLQKQVRIARHAQENYKYDKIVNDYFDDEFTYLEEEKLLSSLYNWKRIESTQTCTCQLCALEQLLLLAYEFAQCYNMGESFLAQWKLGKFVKIRWLEDFEMRHSDEISSFDSFEKCSTSSKEFLSKYKKTNG